MRELSFFLTLSLSVAASHLFAQQPQTTTPAVLDIASRMREQQPFDGNGGYKLLKDDGIRSKQGLLTLAGRWGAKPYDQLGTGNGIWSSERVIFRDVDTGTWMMRLSNDHFADQLSYFQGNWTADGQFIVWRRRPGMWESSTATHGPMAMNADGTNLRNAFRDTSMVEGLVCSPTIPNECYAIAQRKQLVVYDVSTGQRKRVLRDIEGAWHLKISMDGKYLINRGNTSDGKKGIWIVSTDGKEYYDFPLPEPIHDSYRIDPARKKVMFWYEGKFGTEGFVECNFDGSDKRKVNVQFDWNHGDVGPDRGIHTGGYVTMIEGEDGWGPKINLFGAPQTHGDEGMVYDNIDFNGYTSWWPKDRLWAYHTRIVRAPYVSELEEWRCEPAPDQYANRYRICYTGNGRGKALDCPNTSPDGTKVLFNSDMLGSVDIYCAVARLPECPTGLKVEKGADGVHLSWSPAAHHAETAGYHVYRSDESGANFQPLTGKAIAATQCVLAGDDGNNHFYAVTAVEHSGLESALSEEATLVSSPKRRIFMELERAKLTPEMWVGFSGSASELRYLWMRKTKRTGTATIPLTLTRPFSANATVWARVKGKAGVRFNMAAGGATTAISAEPLDDWRWVKAGTPLPLKAVENLELTSSTYGAAIDCIALTDDGSFDPNRSARIAMPELKTVGDLKIEVRSPYETKLSWNAPDSSSLDHYNVYCGMTPDFRVDQTNLVASPKVCQLVDWGLRPGQSYWYAVTAVDRAGNEGPASSPVNATTKPLKEITIEKDFTPSIEFDAPDAGVYVLWLHVLQQNGGSVYIEAKIDNAGGGSWVGTGDNLSKTYWLSYDQWGRFNLKSGRHTLTISNKMASRIDKVRITNDLSYRPTDDHVTTLSGW